MTKATSRWKLQRIDRAFAAPLACAALLGGSLACASEADKAHDPETEPVEVSMLSELPPGHPRVADPQSGAAGVFQPTSVMEDGAHGLRWEVPKNWTVETPTSSMRRAQYRIAGTDGDAECVVYYFGPGQGGDSRSNAERWADQFGQPDGRSSRDVLKTEPLDVGGIPVLLVEVTGIYSGGMAMMGGPEESLTDYMLLGAIAEGPDANWFFKLTGPRETVSAQREVFRDLLESLERGI